MNVSWTPWSDMKNFDKTKIKPGANGKIVAQSQQTHQRCCSDIFTVNFEQVFATASWLRLIKAKSNKGKIYFKRVIKEQCRQRVIKAKLILKNGPRKICGRQTSKTLVMVCLNRPCHSKLIKGFLPQNLLSPFLNTLPQISLYLKPVEFTVYCECLKNICKLTG